jgi:crotonobetainyl-CoA:carnitine CoA-transferase CaiB-like acyl-CoA transferase
MTQVMKGVRILDVAHFTFVPAAGAAFGDGADVIEIEQGLHRRRPDLGRRRHRPVRPDAESLHPRSVQSPGDRRKTAGVIA